jgi:hypothetical protein
MENSSHAPISKSYLAMIVLLMLVLPVLSAILDHYLQDQESTSISLAGKWFVFWAVGIRLCTGGIKQGIDPSFTAKGIFHLKEEESFVVVRELGFANICLGLTGIISLFVSGWRPAAAFAGGLYLGIAGFGHLAKKPVSMNEWIAMVSDLFIFLVVTVYLVNYYW